MGTKQFVQYQLAPEIYKINEAVEQITASMTGLESKVLSALGGVKAVKSVQRGVVDTSGVSLPVTVTISAVSKALVTAEIGTSIVATENSFNAGAWLNSLTSIQVARFGTNEGSNKYVRWQVVDFM